MDYENILAKIKPTKAEQENVLKLAYKIISSLKIKNAKPFLGGSTAKGTWLKGNNDIDIYARFPLSLKNEDISKMLRNSLRRLKGVKRIHGSRDYYQLKKNNFVIELIPILEIKKPEDAINITDISPLHVEWVTKSMLKKQELADEIRLAKAFLTAHRIYGAESYINGLSGYATEVLVIHYIGFENFVKAAASWKEKTIIDTAKHYKSNPLLKLNPAKAAGKLILIDPVQKDRNAASSLSDESYDKLIGAAKRFISKPSEDFFKEQKFSATDLKENGFIVAKMKPLKKSEDVAGTKLYKAHQHIAARLVEEGFGLKKQGFNFDGKLALSWLMPESMELSEKMKHFGPPIKNEKALESFTKKWGRKNVVIENDKCYVMLGRKFANAKKLIQYELISKYVKERSAFAELA